MGQGVQLGHQGAEGRIDAQEHGAGGLDGQGQCVPEAVWVDREARDGGLATLPGERAAVGELAASAGEEGRAGEEDRARPGLQDLRLEIEQVGPLLAEMAGHEVRRTIGRL